VRCLSSQPTAAASRYAPAPTNRAAVVLTLAAADASSGRLNWAKLRGTGVSDITGARSSRLTTCARCAYRTVPVSATGTERTQVATATAHKSGDAAVTIAEAAATIIAGQNNTAGCTRSTSRPVSQVAIVVST